MCSNASVSVPAPEPRATARSMLSFGIEYDRAFSIAFGSARLFAGSGPPSRAATMIARASLEKSFPRLASAAPFLCLIEDHLLCPDTAPLLYRGQEELVHAGVVGQLGMEGGDEKAAVADEHRFALELREDLDALTDLADARCADEHPAQRPALPRELEIRLEAGHLAPESVPVDLEVDGAEMVAVEDDHPRAGSEDRPAERRDRRIQAIEAHQAHERGRLAAWNDEAVEALELLRLANLGHVRAKTPEDRSVLAKVALQGENADLRPTGHRRSF